MQRGSLAIISRKEGPAVWQPAKAPPAAIGARTGPMIGTLDAAA